MKKLLNQILRRFGFVIISVKEVKRHTTAELKSLYNINEYTVAHLRGKSDQGLKQKLINENKTKWLDVGCGGNFEPNFYYVDTFPEAIVSEKDKYFRLDVVNGTEHEFVKIGKYDLIRMQHVFEHFTPEDGLKVLKNLSKVLNPDGYILITTPDLKKFIDLYLAGKIKEDFPFALNRVEKDSPGSFYFSVFAHSVLYQKHLWCYDAEGIIYQLEKAGIFKNIHEIKLDDDLANYPFTHNRPEYDVCVIAQLK